MSRRKILTTVNRYRYTSPLGEIIISGGIEKLHTLRFANPIDDLSLYTELRSNTDNEWSEKTLHWLDSYFGGNIPQEIPELELNLTLFRKQILALTQDIPYGETRTYGDLGRMQSAYTNHRYVSPRAVGAALGANPIWLIIPCHRVIGAKGKLTGYAGGLELKEKLLMLEQDVMSRHNKH